MNRPSHSPVILPGVHRYVGTSTDFGTDINGSLHPASRAHSLSHLLESTMQGNLIRI